MPHHGIDHTAYCVVEGCVAEYKNHRWGHSKASAEGWFFSKTLGAMCPDHVPDWVAEWRAKNTTKEK